MVAVELHARRLNAKEVLTPQRSGNVMFPITEGTVKIFGCEQRLRTSTSTRETSGTEEEQEILQGKSDELDSPTQLQDDSTRDDEEAKSNFMNYYRRILSSSSRCTPSQTVHAERSYQSNLYATGSSVGEKDRKLQERGWRK